MIFRHRGLDDRIRFHCLMLGFDPARALSARIFRLLFFPHGLPARGLEPGAVVIDIRLPGDLGLG